MITASALDLIKMALKMAGVLSIGQTPQAEDSNDALILLNSMLASWQQNRWLVWHLIDVNHRSSGTQSYSIGPGADFDVVNRPDRLQSAYARLLNVPPGGSGPVDYPLTIIETMEEYGQIAIKQLKSWPSFVFYDPTLTIGTLYFWPIPDNSFELHLILKDVLTHFDSLSDQFLFPPEYFEALLYNLTGRLCMLYQVPMSPGVAVLAQAGVNTIRAANHRVANLMMPAGLSRHGGWPTHGVPGVVEGTFRLDQSVLGPS